MTVLGGADAGGSHTEAVVSRGSPEPAARSSGAPGILSPGRVTEAAHSIATVVKRALEQADLGASCDLLVVGAAGAGRVEQRESLSASLKQSELASRILVTTDAEIVLEDAFGTDPGIAICAGTGSIGYARLPSGEVRRSGGLGWQSGDEGSGYALGRAALGAIGRAADGRGAQTQLREEVLRELNIDSLEELWRWASAATPAQVAALAEVVARTALAGDEAAGSLVTRAGDDLTDHITALVAHFPQGSDVSVALHGGLLRKGSPIRDSLQRAAETALPRARILETEVDPAKGALAIAYRTYSEQ